MYSFRCSDVRFQLQMNATSALEGVRRQTGYVDLLAWSGESISDIFRITRSIFLGVLASDRYKHQFRNSGIGRGPKSSQKSRKSATRSWKVDLISNKYIISDSPEIFSSIGCSRPLILFVKGPPFAKSWDWVTYCGYQTAKVFAF